MNITYIFGNGFDIGLGMKTAYKQFYPYFIEHSAEDNMIRKELIKAKEESGEYKNWSDLEWALGKYIKKVSPNNYEKFVKDKNELDKLLREYLIEQEEGFDSKVDFEKIIGVLSSVRNSGKENIDKKIKAALLLNKQETYVFEAVSLNYTGIIDMCFQTLVTNNRIIGSQQDGNGTWKEMQIGNVLHLHGTLKDDDIIIGVNDKSQIENEDLAKLELVRIAMIKSELNEYVGQERVAKCKSIIDHSCIICLYGVSVGATDFYIWEYIAKWLQASNSRLLIIYDHVEDELPTGNIKKWQHEKFVKDKFLGLTVEDNGKWESLKNQIIVFANRDDFALENIEQNDLHTENIISAFA